MNSKRADNNTVEEIFVEFTVTYHNPNEQIGVYEVNRHKKLIEHHISVHISFLFYKTQ